MTKQERETFLADLHVGVVSISEEGQGPLTVGSRIVMTAP